MACHTAGNSHYQQGSTPGFKYSFLADNSLVTPLLFIANGMAGICITTH